MDENRFDGHFHHINCFRKLKLLTRTIPLGENFPKKIHPKFSRSKNFSYKWKCANQVRMSKEDMDEDGFELTDDSGDDLTDCESDSEISTLIRLVFSYTMY